MNQIIIMAIVCFSTSTDSWQSHARFETEDHFYYTGISAPQSNEKRARDEAVFQARQTFFIEHFGVLMRLNERAWNSLDRHSLTQELSMVMATLYLKGEKIEKIEREDSVTRVLLSYPKKAVQSEILRLRDLKPSGLFLEASEDSVEAEFWGKGSAELLIKTDPEGALVYLDGEPLGKTPLHARRLSAGPTDLELILPLHKKLKKTVILNDASPLTLEERLVPEEGFLVLDVVPKDANIKIPSLIDVQAQFFDEVPMPAGNYNVSLNHPDYENTLVEIFVAPGSKTFRRIELVPRPAKLSFVSKNYPFEIELHDQAGMKQSHLVKSSEVFLVGPKFSNLIVRKSGFKVFEKPLILKPNVAMPIMVDLEKEERRIFASLNTSMQSEQRRSLLKNPWFWGGLIGVAILTGVLSTTGGSGSSPKPEAPTPLSSPSPPPASPTSSGGSSSGGVRIKGF